MAQAFPASLLRWRGSQIGFSKARDHKTCQPNRPLVLSSLSTRGRPRHKACLFHRQCSLSPTRSSSDPQAPARAAREGERAGRARRGVTGCDAHWIRLRTKDAHTRQRRAGTMTDPFELEVEQANRRAAERLAREPHAIAARYDARRRLIVITLTTGEDVR